MIKVGCCGFGRARAQYYQHLSLVEVQRTFYKPPRLQTCQRWRAEAPPTFEFSIKAWQLVTHESTSPTYRKARLKLERPERYGSFRPTDEVLAAWEETVHVAKVLGARLVLFQCPASFNPSSEHVADMRSFFGAIDRCGLRLVWEPRGEWSNEEIQGLCRELDLLHCVDPFKRSSVHGEPAYFRLHGKKGYGYHYTDEDLKRVLEWCVGYQEAYCLFNNVSMFEDASRLDELRETDNRALACFGSGKKDDSRPSWHQRGPGMSQG